MTLALGDAREELENIGVYHTATASPGGSGALFLAAANYADRSKVLLRDRHWGPYDGFLAGCGLGDCNLSFARRVFGLRFASFGGGAR